MTLLDALRGKLIVSVQAPSGTALDDPYVLAAMARAAQDAGAAAVRMQGIANLRAARERVSVPIIGIVKRRCAGFEPFITPTLDDARQIAAVGCEIVAFDVTRRPRPDGSSTRDVAAAIHQGGALAMADCAEPDDGLEATSSGVDVLATTLCGYTAGTEGVPLPALELVRAFARTGKFVICEGGIRVPKRGRAALDAGADAIVVGNAITGLARLVGDFREALAK